MTLYTVNLVNELTGERLTLTVDVPSGADAQRAAVLQAWRDLGWRKVFAKAAQEVGPSDEDLIEGEVIEDDSIDEDEPYAAGEALGNGEAHRITTPVLQRFLANIETNREEIEGFGLAHLAEVAAARARAELKRRGVPEVEESGGTG